MSLLGVIVIDVILAELIFPKGYGLITLFKNEMSSLISDRRLRKICDKIKDDPQVQDYIQNQNKRGFRKMLSSKLNDEDIKYVNQICRKHFTD